MRTVCLDPGHGGSDPGGRSLGTPEKLLVLPYALRLAEYMEAAGWRVLLTRRTDVAVGLSERARLANDGDADLFVSVHANASEHPSARGPWTIHAAPSERGAEIARAVQAALARVLGGSAGAVYPDASPWVGGRRLAVLRQTRMPAVLVELGFMTNAEDLRQLEAPATVERTAAALADAIVSEMGPRREVYIPAITPSVVRPPLRVPVPDLRRIERPTPAHVDAILGIRGYAPEAAEVGLAVAEVLLRGVVGGVEGLKREAVKRAADALADWLKGRAA